MPTVTYKATLCTRKANSSANAKTDRACQEFFTDDYNYVGIIHFPNMAQANKVITGITMHVVASASGFGAEKLKTVYFRKSRYQAVSQAGVTGYDYCSDSLGTMNGYFYDNVTVNNITGPLLQNMAEYFAAGNNTLCIYNPNPQESYNGYSENYLQWVTVLITIGYEEAANIPTLSSEMAELGNLVTIYTNRVSTAATHTISYVFGNSSGCIATNVLDAVNWIPPQNLAAEQPSATSGQGTIICDTYVNGSLTGSKSVGITLSIPSSVLPQINAIGCAEATEGIAEKFGMLVQGKSKLAVSIDASGIYGSKIQGYRTSICGSTYSSASFVSNALSTSGENEVIITVTDSRGRSATVRRNIVVATYASPSLTSLHAERCNAAGTAQQMDGNKVRINTTGSVSAVNNRNTIMCMVYYKLSSATAWTQATTLPANNYVISAKDFLLPPIFDPLKSYDIKIRITDYFGYVEQAISVGTKQVIVDFYRDGSGIAFGKVAENSGQVEFGWPVVMEEPLGTAYGGTGQTSLAETRSAMGLGNTTGPLPVANGGTGAKTIAEARAALGQGNTSGAVPIGNGGTGATSASAARENLGITQEGLGAASAVHTHSAGSITSGTQNPQRLPFRIAHGTTTINGNASIYVSYAEAGFTSVPYVFASYSTTGGNWNGDNGAIKIHTKTTTGFSIVVGGSFSTNRNVDWLAIGT